MFQIHESRAQITYTAKVEIGHIFNDLIWGGKEPKFAPDYNTWESRSFLFSPLAGIHGQVNFKSVYFSLGGQYQKNGRTFSQAVRNISGHPEIQISRFSQRFTFNKFSVPLSIGLKNKKKKHSESLFIGIRPSVYTKANFESVTQIVENNHTAVNSSSVNMLSNASPGRTIPKTDFQGFLGFCFPEEGPFSVSLVIYMGNIYAFNKMNYEFHNYQTKYVNLDGVLSLKYCFRSK